MEGGTGRGKNKGSGNNLMLGETWSYKQRNRTKSDRCVGTYSLETYSPKSSRVRNGREGLAEERRSNAR